MLTQAITGFLAGLSVGIYCIGACLPIFVPLILADKQSTFSSLRIVLEFSLGRLLGYLTFGGLVGYLGETVSLGLIHQLVKLATLLMGIVLIIFSLGFLSWKRKACKIFFAKVRVPVLLGFLTGVNVCPPFLASLSYVFTLKNFLSSILYFLFFFLGTSFYIIPLGVLGVFSHSNRLQKIAHLSGVFAGIYFIISSLR